MCNTLWSKVRHIKQDFSANTNLTVTLQILVGNPGAKQNFGRMEKHAIMSGEDCRNMTELYTCTQKLKSKQLEHVNEWEDAEDKLSTHQPIWLAKEFMVLQVQIQNWTRPNWQSKTKVTICHVQLVQFSGAWKGKIYIHYPFIIIP